MFEVAENTAHGVTDAIVRTAGFAESERAFEVGESRAFGKIVEGGDDEVRGVDGGLEFGCLAIRQLTGAAQAFEQYRPTRLRNRRATFIVATQGLRIDA